ncbi:site-2 protease family protein [Patescibacteria group bacterium]|nr:site-2 protease family protein [Patescibacteria group bacterium]
MTIFIAIISLLLLVTLHELGHFLFAKKFGVRVDEFGIGYPPRLFGKKIGETLYSWNLLPLGGFVKIYGHEERINDPRSFTTKPFWQKSVIILGGVAVFWVIATVLLTAVMMIGAPSIVEDYETTGFKDAKVQIAGVSKDSPAFVAELEIGDVIKTMNGVSVDKVIEVQDIAQENKGREILMEVQRGQSVLEIYLTPREEVPGGEGPIGIALFRTALKQIPWYQAPIEGIKATGNLTVSIVQGWGMVLGSLFSGNGVPEGVEIKGAVGIFELFNGIGSLGVSYFLQLVAIIAISLALINSLPIPALDGGWFLFLVIEKIKGKPLNEKIIQNVSIVFFVLLVTLMLWITIKDVIGLF